MAKTLNTNTILAESYYKLYLDRGIENENYSIQFFANYYLGNIAYRNKKYDKTIHYGNNAITSAENIRNGNYMLSGLYLVAAAYQEKRDRKNSLNRYLRAQKIIEDYNLKDYQIYNLVSIGQIRIRLDQTQKALASFQKAFKLLQKSSKKSDTNYDAKYLSIIQGIGVCYYKLGNYDEALKYDYQGLQYAEKLNLIAYIIDFNLNIGEAYIGKQKYPKALSYLNIAKADIIELNKTNDPDLFTANLHIATCLYNQTEYSKARDVLEQNFHHIKTNPEVEKIQEAYLLAIKCGEKLQDTSLQFKYTKAYNKIVDSLYQNDINAQEKLYDRDLESLEEKNKNLISKNFLYASGFLLALVFAAVILFYTIKTKKKNKSLFEELQKGRIQESVSKTLSVQKNDFITDKKAKSLLERLLDLEKTTFYLSPDCSLYTTAKDIETNTTYLSKIINEYKQQSFNDYINELRIKFCIEQLNTNHKFRSYTIKAIAGELGYKSVNTFASAFKKQTGLSHSYFIKKVISNTHESSKIDI
ncbi:helix-turn-helix domain-containing protein [Aquimarina sp. 2304DJ70-9]|uniref:helix-turn-helix domain-containing protein n=1 Tax=Aquimarina penaris TaxID=3231044 RepID=UPI0034619BF4